MGHHYLPKRYLRGFTRDDRLFVFEKPGGRSFKSSPESVANERELYTEELESRLNNEVEQPAAEVFHKIALRQAISRADKETLSLYMAMAWKRVPAARARVNAALPGATEEVIDELVNEVGVLAGRGAIDTNRYARLLVDLERARESLLNDPPPEAWHYTIDIEQSRRNAEVVAGMRWALLMDTSASVVTCDNPVYFFPWAGVARPESELVFPINASTVLFANHEGFKDCSYLKGSPMALKEFNRRLIHNAERHVFAPSAHEWVSKLMVKNVGVTTRISVLQGLPMAPRQGRG